MKDLWDDSASYGESDLGLAVKLAQRETAALKARRVILTWGCRAKSVWYGTRKRPEGWYRLVGWMEDGTRKKKARFLLLRADERRSGETIRYRYSLGQEVWVRGFTPAQKM